VSLASALTLPAVTEARLEAEPPGESMHRDNREEDSEGIVTLLKETADGFGRLISDHLKLTRLELVADVKAQGRRVATLAVAIPLLFLGYAIVCLGLAVVLSQRLGLGCALLLVGGVHLVGGAAASFIVVRRLRDMDLMGDTAYEIDRSVSTLTERATNGAVPGAAPERTASGARATAVETPGGSRIAEPQA
jgi:hypothetical protein